MPRHTDTTHHQRSALRLAAGVLALAAAASLLAACDDDATPTATAPPTTPIADDRPTTTIPSPTVVPTPGDDQDGDHDVPVEEPAVTPPSGEPPATTVPAGDPSSAPVELEDGRHFGYLVGYELDSHATAAAFDLAQLFTGDAADEAAAQDGVIGPGKQIENDVYIGNVSTRLRRALFRDDATITVVDCSSVRSDRTTLQNRPTPTPVWLTVTGGVVVAADEVYLP